MQKVLPNTNQCGHNFFETAPLVQHLICVRGTLDYHPNNVEQAAEAYCMGTLGQPEEATLEDHYITCAECAGIVENTDWYVHAMQEAARRLRGFASKTNPAGAVTD